MQSRHSQSTSTKQPIVFYFLAFAAIVVLANMFLHSIASPTTSYVDKLRIAGNLPLSGPIAAFCGQYPKAFVMGVDVACKEYNIPRNNITIDFQDNAGKPSFAVSILRKQMLDQPTVYISGTSDMSLAIGAEVGKANLPHFIVSFDPYFCRRGKSRMRILPHYKSEGPVYVEYARMRKAKRVFILALINRPSDEQFEKIVEPGLAKLGIEYKRERYDFNTKDYRSIALKLAEYKPDLIIVGGCFSVHVYPILGALRNYGLLKGKNVICTLDFIDLIHNKTPKSELIGVPFVTPSCEISDRQADFNAWSGLYKQIYKTDPSYVDAYAYDTARILVAAYKQSGVVNEKTIRAILPFRGVSDNITLDADGDLSSKLYIAQLMSNGEVKELGKAGGLVAKNTNYGKSNK